MRPTETACDIDRDHRSEKWSIIAEFNQRTVPIIQLVRLDPERKCLVGWRGQTRDSDLVILIKDLPLSYLSTSVVVAVLSPIVV